LLGAGVGLVRGRRIGWAAYGLAAPFIAAGVVWAAAAAARPIREVVADRREDACRAEGRSICSVREFDAACSGREVKKLGPPAQSICNGASCTLRWVYRGPFRPDQISFKGGFLCSIVDGTRASVIAVADP
jgi:hypothetical protein